jgi:hypothetical protein
LPLAMLWRGDDGKRDVEWARFTRTWSRPEIIFANEKAKGDPK